MGDAIHAFLANYDQSEPSIPAPRAQCCCGNEACAYLKHNQNALDGLETDVSTAARLGKALLIRHESYIADSERERRAMALQIETLEMEKQLLERRNTAAIEENRLLLDQLESVNNAVVDSDDQMSNLQATLESTQQELQKLQNLANRTATLEQQIIDFEHEQTTWQISLEAKTQSEKSALSRCQKAERALADIQDQIERIEREASEEKNRHVEIVERMERRHAVERELGSAAGRLKGAAALKTTASNDTNGPNVVSHFVKDILQDNANLQMGIVELREMLNTSNEEVEKLRDQIALSQTADDGEAVPQPSTRHNDLRTELTRANSSEVHVHHHYHPPPSAPKPLRRKKRLITPGHHTPSSGNTTPRSSFSHTPRSSFSQTLPTPTAAILQQTAASVPQAIPDGKRWSTHSSQTYPSLASSPQSVTNRTSSLFERVFSDAGVDSSRPATPDTEVFGSPVLWPSHSRKASASSFRTFSAPVVLRRAGSPTGAGRSALESIVSIEELPTLDIQASGQDTIPEESEADWENADTPYTEDNTGITSPSSEEVVEPAPDSPRKHAAPTLRRTTSHESVFSVAAMDIHTLRSRPSQLLGSYRDRVITPQAVISDATAHATRPAVISRTTTDSRNLLSGMTAEPRHTNRPTLGKKVGGWMFGKWGGAVPTSTQVDPVSKDTTKITTAPKASSISSASIKSGDDVQPAPTMPRLRPPGVNQMGPIFGLGPEIKVQHAPVMQTLDEEELRTALGND